MIHVCSLAALHPTVEMTGASHILTRDRPMSRRCNGRPRSAEANHLIIDMDDITEEIDGFRAPSLGPYRAAPRLRAGLGPRCAAGGALLRRHQPLHRRAFVTACALNPHRDEVVIARQIRERLGERLSEPRASSRWPIRRSAATAACCARSTRSGRARPSWKACRSASISNEREKSRRRSRSASPRRSSRSKTTSR